MADLERVQLGTFHEAARGIALEFELVRGDHAAKLTRSRIIQAR